MEKDESPLGLIERSRMGLGASLVHACRSLDQTFFSLCPDPACKHTNETQFVVDTCDYHSPLSLVQQPCVQVWFGNNEATFRLVFVFS